MDDLNKSTGLEEALPSGDTPEKMVSIEVIESKGVELGDILLKLKKFKRKLGSEFNSFFIANLDKLVRATYIAGIVGMSLQIQSCISNQEEGEESQQAQITDVRGASAETLTENEKICPVSTYDILKHFGEMPRDFLENTLRPALGLNIEGYEDVIEEYDADPELIKSQMIPFLEGRLSHAKELLKPYEMDNKVRYLNTSENREIREGYIDIAYMNSILVQLYTFIGEKGKAESVYNDLAKWMISELVQDQNDPNLRILAARVYSANPSMLEGGRAKGSDRAIFEYNRALILTKSPEERQEIAQEYAKFLEGIVGENQYYQDLYDGLVEDYKIGGEEKADDSLTENKYGIDSNTVTSVDKAYESVFAALNKHGKINFTSASKLENVHINVKHPSFKTESIIGDTYGGSIYINYSPHNKELNKFREVYRYGFSAAGQYYLWGGIGSRKVDDSGNGHYVGQGEEGWEGYPRQNFETAEQLSNALSDIIDKSIE